MCYIRVFPKLLLLVRCFSLSLWFVFWPSYTLSFCDRLHMHLFIPLFFLFDFCFSFLLSPSHHHNVHCLMIEQAARLLLVAIMIRCQLATTKKAQKFTCPCACLIVCLFIFFLLLLLLFVVSAYIFASSLLSRHTY